MRLIPRVFLFQILFLLPAFLVAQTGSINWNRTNEWIDSVYNSLSDDDKISQLMIVDVWPARDSLHIEDVAYKIRDLHVGGLIFFKGTPTRQALLTNYFQSLSRVPLMIGIDGEWGLSMRLDSTPVFPRQLVMGAAHNEELVYAFGRTVGKQCKRMGIHFNFAPDVDVNNNPDNPVINDRSFGENRIWVSKLGTQYMKGLQDEHILASAKHFPGHGDVSTDSHYSLPVITADRKRLDSLELYPFKQLIKNDVTSVMIAHLNVPALDSTHTPSSLSYPIVTELLRNEMGFEGIVITDALNMKGVADLYPGGEVAARALVAGNDLLLFVEDVPFAVSMIKQYITDSVLTWDQIESSCKKILKAKYWAGLNAYKPIETDHLIEDLNCCEANRMIKRIIKEGIVVARNDDAIIPIQNPELYTIACLSVGAGYATPFQEMTMRYMQADYFSIDKQEQVGYFDSLYLALKGYNLVIVSLQNTSRFAARQFGLTQPQIDFVSRLLQDATKKIILVSHGNPYILRHFEKARNVIVGYEDLELYNQLTAQVLFGAVKAKATLPVTVGESFALMQGITTKSLNRFEYIYPEEQELDALSFSSIDTIVAEAIRNKATPGCQVLVARNNKVIYNKSFGYHTYDSTVAVKNYHVYDVASLTKILATTLAVMHLHDEGKVKPDEKVSVYLPELLNTNKSALTLQDILLHQAGLPAFIPFYEQTLVRGKPNPLIYSTAPDSNYAIRVAPHLYMHASFSDFIWNEVIRSEVNQPGKYVYSDLGFMILMKMVERVSGMSFENYLNNHIYKPLGLSTIGFNPLYRINQDWIIPTETDMTFRNEQITGTVHDQAAAMMGGISGHAGLFSNMNDVAVIMQMLLQGGEYGGKRILKESTVKEFTRKYSKTNRRGLGFDKPETDPKKPSPIGPAASPAAFGHSGFTGTCAWADPKYDLVYVFLSNRVYPSAGNKKLADTNVRTRILDAIYEALEKRN